MMVVHGNLWDLPEMVITNITMENHHRNSGFCPLNIVIFHSYV